MYFLFVVVVVADADVVNVIRFNSILYYVIFFCLHHVFFYFCINLFYFISFFCCIFYSGLYVLLSVISSLMMLSCVRVFNGFPFATITFSFVDKRKQQIAEKEKKHHGHKRARASLLCAHPPARVKELFTQTLTPKTTKQA